jgi:LuxR family maltose regulon positive regulatory protein
VTKAASPWLVLTKLRPPLPRADAVVRGRLLARLDAAVVAHPLTLISAPAGSGKTTLLASWLAQRMKETGAAAPSFAWLSLDDQDDDPAVFLAALTAAAGRLAPACGEQVRATLASGADPRAELAPLVGLLINELDELLAAPAVLILDDLHAAADPAIHRALELLVERMPPRLRLVVATRHDPPLALARLRARRQVAELRLADLRFTREDTAHLLNAALGLDLAADVVGAVHERTEGWAAGVGLLAASLEGDVAAGERERILAGLQRTERAVFDYLAEEVLERQDPFVRMFLLETSILPELTPAICAAVTGRHDAAAILDGLYRRNLFLIELDPEPAAPQQLPTYRYHDLFADFLRARLGREHPGWLRDLHRRAAQHATTPARRVAHLLGAGLADKAADEVEAAGPELLLRGAVPTLRQLVEALPAWSLAARPGLMALYGVALTQLWELAAARPWLERAAAARAAAGDDAGEGDLLAHLADTQRMLGDYEAAAATSARLRDRPLPPAARAHRLLSAAWQALADGDAPAATAAMEQLQAAVERPDGQGALYLVATGYHSPFLALPGGLPRAERFCRALAAAVDQRSGPLQAAIDMVAAWCALLRGRLDDAGALAARALTLAERLGGLAWLDPDAALMPWLIAGMGGDMAAARRGYADFLARLERSDNVASTAWRPLYHTLIARMEWLHGDAARFLADAAQLAGPPAPADWPGSASLRRLVQGLAALRDGDHAEAERLLREAAAAQARYVTMRLAGDARVALAHLYRVQGRPDDALAAFAPALADAARDDAPGRFFVEGTGVAAPLLRLAAERGHDPAFAARALAALQALGAERQTQSKPQSPPPSAFPEPLTARELEVLQLLVAGASNQAIADRLVISLHTVKRHVTNILQKLDATSRLDAVARARAAGLV